MFSTFTKVFLIIVVGVAYYTQYSFKQELVDPVKGFVSIVIGILSARENFQHRDSIRKTWLNSTHGNDDHFKHWFILGNQHCPVPPQCRRKKYDCEKWQLNFTAVQRVFRTSHEVRKEECTENRKAFHQGFSFQVNHNVVVTKLGLYSRLMPTGANLTISLLDLQTKAVVVNATLSKKPESNNEGYVYKPVEQFLLPKNYEGLILVEGSLLQSACGVTRWNSNGGILTFSRVYISADDVESVAFSEGIRVAPSVEFQVQDISDLHKVSEFCKNDSSDWEMYNEKMNERLIEENKTWSDLLFLDMLDTYRNLPRKMLLFYTWLSQKYQFNYLLKTDDDSFLDLKQISLQLEKKQFDPNKMWIWSRFRSSWPVNYVGKWADYDYKSPVYPIFPCGGAYVLSRKTVEWVQMNSGHLFAYQGEDVSLGIWLSAINPLYFEDKRWECDQKCSQNSFNRAQLTPQEIFDVWEIKTKCDNLCQC